MQTPNLDALAADGVRFSRHYSQASPCSPGRACLYTGTYQMNNRVVANGTPLDRHARQRRARWRGDTATTRCCSATPTRASTRATPPDPTIRACRCTPACCPGFDPLLELDDDQVPWREWLERARLRRRGQLRRALSTESERPAEHSISAFLTDTAIEWLARPGRAVVRPPQLPAPAPAVRRRRSLRDDVRPGRRRAADRTGGRHDIRCTTLRDVAADHRRAADEAGLRALARPVLRHDQRRRHAGRPGVGGAARARHVGRHGDRRDLRPRRAARRSRPGAEARLLRAELPHLGIVRDPRHAADARHAWSTSSPRTSTSSRRSARRSTRPCRRSATACRSHRSSRGEQPPWWRDAAHWEFDWRDRHRSPAPATWPWDRRLERQHLAARRDRTTQYVQFGNGSWLCFDLAADPTSRTPITDPAVVLRLRAGDADVARPARRSDADRHARRSRRHRSLSAGRGPGVRGHPRCTSAMISANSGSRAGSSGSGRITPSHNPPNQRTITSGSSSQRRLRNERVDDLVGDVFVQRVPALGAGDRLQPLAEVFPSVQCQRATICRGRVQEREQPSVVLAVALDIGIGGAGDVLAATDDLELAAPDRRLSHVPRPAPAGRSRGSTAGSSWWGG